MLVLQRLEQLLYLFKGEELQFGHTALQRFLNQWEHVVAELSG